jgi:hypothetical protein
MGIVKFFSPSGGTPAPPTYLNYVGMLAGSYANQQALNGTDGEIIIPLNNVSRNTNPNNPKNVVSVDFANSGQDISFYIVGANIVISRADTGVREFRGDIFVDGQNVYRRTFEINEEGVIDMVLDSAISVQYEIYVSLTTDNISFDIVSSNWLFYSTGNIIPPTACEYFEVVSAGNGGAVLTCISPIEGSFKQTPLIYQANNWAGGTAGNRVPRIRNWNQLSSDSTATLIQGQTYYVEVTFSTPLPIISSVQKNMGLYFGYNINSRTNPFPITVDGSLTTPQGFYLEWNPNNEIDPLFMFIGESMPSPNQYNGQITFKVGTENCPI